MLSETLDDMFEIESTGAYVDGDVCKRFGKMGVLACMNGMVRRDTARACFCPSSN